MKSGSPRERLCHSFVTAYLKDVDARKEREIEANYRKSKGKPLAHAHVEFDVDGVVENATAAHGSSTVGLQLEDGEEERKSLQITCEHFGIHDDTYSQMSN